MANELVKEIEDLQSYINGSLGYAREHETVPTVGVDTAYKLLNTLQRARDALRWKPIDENTPYDTILLFMSHDGNVRQDFIYDEGLERAQRQYIGWMEIPAYTPEEK